MLDHVGLPITDFERSKAFYAKALAPLGYVLLMEFDRRAAGFGKDGKPDFWIGIAASAPARVHVAFASPDRATVRAFHAAALAAGGEDHGAPGLRPEYHPHYYGAFVLDPDGRNVEAVSRLPE